MTEEHLRTLAQYADRIEVDADHPELWDVVNAVRWINDNVRDVGKCNLVVKFVQPPTIDASKLQVHVDESLTADFPGSSDREAIKERSNPANLERRIGPDNRMYELVNTIAGGRTCIVRPVDNDGDQPAEIQPVDAGEWASWDEVT